MATVTTQLKTLVRKYRKARMEEMMINANVESLKSEIKALMLIHNKKLVEVDGDIFVLAQINRKPIIIKETTYSQLKLDREKSSGIYSEFLKSFENTRENLTKEIEENRS